ncbi:MAG: outer membrane lipoprotein carrier protein LolA, partial [bacterium]
MKKKMVLIKMFLATCLVIQAVILQGARAEETKADPVIQRVQEWYDKLSDLQADFRQKTFSQTLNRTTEAQGKIYFKKPNLMKWNYISPEKQIYVINHENFWWYVPEDAQVVKRKASTVLQDTTPLSFLAGLGNLRKSF